MTGQGQAGAGANVAPEAVAQGSGISSGQRSRWVALAVRAAGVVALLAQGLVLPTALADPINSPYAAQAEGTNTLFTAFTNRSPRYLDPASSYSNDETPYTYSIYQPLYAYHYLKRPYTLTPWAAAEVVEPVYVDAEGNELPADAPGADVAESRYDIPIKPGMRFAPHPAFARDANGQLLYHSLTEADLADIKGIPDFPETGTRELTAHDFVYQIKRLASPRLVSPIYTSMGEHLIGLRTLGEQLRAEATAEREAGQTPSQWLDLRHYPIAGAEALDDHTLRLRVNGKYPQFKYWLAMTFFSPMPWEADAFYSQPGMAQRNLSLNSWPVGSGPYYMAENRRNWRAVLARNPYFNSATYPCEGDAYAQEQGLLEDCGKPMPFIDRAVFSIEKEALPLQGKFMQGYYDVPQIERGEYGVMYRVAADDSVEKAELYAERGLQLPMTIETSIWYIGFNWRDPVVGQGETPEQEERNRKLRQAISIALNWEEYVALFESNQAQVAYGPVPPGVLGHQEGVEGINPYVYDVVDGKPVRKSLDEARRLLAEAGYPNGRALATGQPLVLHYDAMLTGPDPRQDWLRRQFAQLGIQLEIRGTDYNRFQDKMRRGVAQIFLWGWLADYPDAENFLFLLYGPNAKANDDGENAANYNSPAFNALFEQMRYLDDGPEKEALIHDMIAVTQRDAVWMFGYYPASAGAYQQWVHNARPSQMIRNTLPYLRLEPARRAELVDAWNQPVLWPLGLLALVVLALAWPAWRLARRRAKATALSGDDA